MTSRPWMMSSQPPFPPGLHPRPGFFFYALISSEFPRIPLLETVWKILSTSQSPYHEPRHRHIDERFSGGAQPLVVLAHPTVLREPREGALHHPAARQYLKSTPRQQLFPVWLHTFFSPFSSPYPRYVPRDRLRGTTHDLDDPRRTSASRNLSATQPRKATRPRSPAHSNLR